MSIANKGEKGEKEKKEPTNSEWRMADCGSTSNDIWENGNNSAKQQQFS